jgi:hypothetical protein
MGWCRDGIRMTLRVRMTLQGWDGAGMDQSDSAGMGWCRDGSE